MGKGTGCVPSKWKKADMAESDPASVVPEDVNSNNTPLDVQTPSEVQDQHVNLDTPKDEVHANDLTNLVITLPQADLKVFIVYYSTYGHVLEMAKKVKEGVDSVKGVHGHLFQVPETLSEDVLDKMKAPAKDTTIPTIYAQDLPSADAIIFGFPTRYGSMAAQMKAFFDSTGALWKGQKLMGKAAGIFVSTATQGGGQETTAMTAITQLVHHGMLYVPIGYTFGKGMFNMDECQGGSAYGAGTFAGNGTRRPTEVELAMAKYQGELTANVVKRLAKN